MAYDEHMAERVRRFFMDRKANFSEQKMFGGICYMVNDKMCCGILFDKKKNTDLLMARIGEAAAAAHAHRVGFEPMDFTGRPMRGYVFITPDGYDSAADLEFCLDLCLQFNPLAKASIKRKGSKKSEK